MNEEGVIKFNCRWIQSDPPPPDSITELNHWRDRLYSLRLIGSTPDGIGYGNMSIRFGNEFIITGSGTGVLPRLGPEHYTRVTEYDFNANSLTTTGPIKASSESLTHAALYECNEAINAVIHVHHSELWKKLLELYPSTDAAVAYGTPGMAREIKRLFQQTALPQRIFAMGGHEGGIISFGKDIAAAADVLLEKFETVSSKW
ncbi:MAG TPA: class II aldolase/adducin family protein [Flavisolibacter sp.]|jgi:ribulose-5-phosphate 4-epimerase/fuculose-1-phosphate aldolase